MTVRATGVADHPTVAAVARRRVPTRHKQPVGRVSYPPAGPEHGLSNDPLLSEAPPRFQKRRVQDPPYDIAAALGACLAMGMGDDGTSCGFAGRGGA